MKQLVWVIDDDEEMVSAVQLMLRLLHYETATFVNARQAADALYNGFLPDLILLDINMPDIGGLEFLEFLRQRQGWTTLPVVMFTSEPADEIVDKALSMGADAYIIKPVVIEELDAAIKRALKAHGKK